MRSRFRYSRQRGQGLVEYALIMVLIAAAIITILLVAIPASTLVNVFSRIGSGLGG